MNDLESFKEQILKEGERLGPDHRFSFRCHPGLPCFNKCCGDVNIVLTPYDVLRLRRRLGLSSTELITRHTVRPFTKEQQLPVVLLKLEDGKPGKPCSFVGEQGCMVYEDRPWACRMYPLGTAEPQNPNPEDHAFHFLLREDLCKGHGQGRDWSVREWISDQGIEEYDMMCSSFKELMLHPDWIKGEPIPAGKLDMVYMACYDLDRFRRFVFETKFLDYFEVDEARIEVMREDDEELLEFAMQWLRFSLFGDKTMKIRKSVIEAHGRAAQAASPGGPSAP